jgi:hypothetical protein
VKEEKMLHRKLPAILWILTLLNVIGLIANLSAPSKAAVADIKYENLMNDRDFVRAVQSIVQACAVNVDTAKARC